MKVQSAHWRQIFTLIARGEHGILTRVDSPVFVANQGECFGPYRLVRKIATGGMAEVYLAFDEREAPRCRPLVLKRIKPELASDPDFIDFFVSEGRVSRRCQHPNIPAFTDYGSIKGVLYIAMEYIDGPSLRDILKACYHRRCHLSIESAIQIAIGVAAGLAHAHGLRDDRGASMAVIHRDVSPQNIMVNSQGVVKLIDFGVVRSSNQAHKTRAGVIKGKFSYMAPEQIRNQEIDGRCDQFALGVCIAEMLQGRPLFTSRVAKDTLKNVLRQTIPSACSLRPTLPAAVGNVIDKSMQRDRDKRYPSTKLFLRALVDASAMAKLHLNNAVMAREIESLTQSNLRGQSSKAKQAPPNTPPKECASESKTQWPAGLSTDQDLLVFLSRAGTPPPDTTWHATTTQYTVPGDNFT